MFSHRYRGASQEAFADVWIVPAWALPSILIITMVVGCGACGYLLRVPCDVQASLETKDRG